MKIFFFFIFLITHYDSDSSYNVQGFLHTTEQFSHTSWMSFNSPSSDTINPEIPDSTGEGLRSTGLPTTPEAEPKFWATGQKWEVLRPPPWVQLINLLEWLTDSGNQFAP